MDTIEIMLTPDQRDALQPLADQLVHLVETQNKAGMILAQVWVNKQKIPHRIEAGFIEEDYALQVVEIIATMDKCKKEVIADDRETDGLRGGTSAESN